MLKKIINRVEHYTVMALLIMMMLVIVVSTVELGIMLVQDLINPPLMLFNINQLLDLFGFFFMILIGLELVETIKMYLDESKIHVEVVFLVAMIAVARKVIILDAKSQDWTTLLAVAAVILALSLGYYLFKMAHRHDKPKEPSAPPRG
ncbi:MAG: phosphate-starvation-inducible PsiE family protein [Proteobacteria bacterium]|nr:phosphate-starvation-inducible PsiE family protein [Pseudomonadota bacterium]MBU4574233.1 phosphate-starvation-inducible PsiE family protein [Pseudomonadota bacterium]MBU4599063.1 phosphate-starvation-inducible PsiE family protein [Pseudomonadota bacterium]MBV1714884.1 phosphate-starvation-inducible PsiE family protein [Desulfarculus sp.]MBV1752877.1 phosphate-starvation-inducible PsiE family protein [Desulfarculus sp.]